MNFDLAAIRRQFPVLRPGLHYLDSAASSQIPAPVIAAMDNFQRGGRANIARGVHRLAERATEAYEGARSRVARALNVAADEIVFTAGCTAALNIAAQGLGSRWGEGDEIVISELDHHSNIVPWQILAVRSGVRLRWLPVTQEGRLDLDALPGLLSPRTRLIAVTHGSNVTAAISDVPRLAAAARSAGALLLLDGAQVAAHGLPDLAALGCDLYAFSAHKLHGPTGIGVLWARRAVLESMAPAFGGGGTIARVAKSGTIFADPPARFEAGTPPYVEAVGLGAAIDWRATIDRNAADAHLARLTQRLVDGLDAIDRQRRAIRVLGPTGPRLPLVSFAVRGAHTHDICQMVDASHGVALRGGHHCAQPLADALGVEGSTRISLALHSGDDDVDAALAAIDQALGRLLR
ncbi:MAG: cysteine desulfurase [Alphaproteobacteria bacterium]|nr:cysteine desulfurase [Alphaproteobacteria bacterium]